MTVYVDNARTRYGRMIMCHMVADTEAELHEMARKISVDRRWFHRGHYNVCELSRIRALRRGAQEISQRQAVDIRRKIEQPA